MVNYLNRLNNDIIMVNIVLIEKTGELKLYLICFCKKEMNYIKNVNLKNPIGFEERHTWNNKKDKYPFSSVTLFARDNGKGKYRKQIRITSSSR